jgi:hypothetical protein
MPPIAGDCIVGQHSLACKPEDCSQKVRSVNWQRPASGEEEVDGRH